MIIIIVIAIIIAIAIVQIVQMIIITVTAATSRSILAEYKNLHQMTPISVLWHDCWQWYPSLMVMIVFFAVW